MSEEYAIVQMEKNIIKNVSCLNFKKKKKSQ